MALIQKTIGWFVGSFALLALLSILSFLVIQQNKDAEAKRNENNKIITNAELLLSNLKDAETGQRGYLLTGDEAYLEPYLTALDSYESQLVELRRQIHENPAQSHRLDVLIPLIKNRIELAKNNINMRRNQDIDGVMKQLRTGRGKQLMDQIRKAINEFVEAEKNILRQNEERFEISQKYLLFFIVFGNGLVLFFAIFGAYWMRRGTQAENESIKSKQYYSRSLIEASQDPLITISPEGKISDMNEGSIKVMGVNREELIGTDFSDYFTEPEKAREGYSQAFAKGIITDYPLTIRHRNGKLTDMLYNASVYKDQRGNVLGVLATARDVSELKRIMQELIETKNFLNNILQSSIKYSIIGKDLKYSIVSWNEGAKRNYGYLAEEIIGKNSSILHTPEDMGSGAVEKLMATAYEKGLAEGEFKRNRKDGSHFIADVVVTRRNDASGNPIGYLLISSDITERKQAEEQLRLAASVFTHAREGIMITSSDFTIIDVNEAFSLITSYSRDEVLGQTPQFLSSGHNGKDFYADMWTNLIENGHWYGEVWNRRKNGELYAVMGHISAVRDDQNNLQHYVAMFNDITVLKEHENELKRMAHFDALTCLPNRVLLADRMRQGMAQARRRPHPLAVAFLDLDGFKAINDDYGHEAGDQLLITVANRMKQALREGDTLARLGGDEFVAVLLDVADDVIFEPMLTRLLAAAAQPVQYGEITLQVSASLGVTFYPQAEDIDADQLLRQADQAMYQAKQAGKNRYHLFDALLDRTLRGHYETLDRIRYALTAGEFVLYYQPKVDMRTGAIVGAEALIRWQHPEKGLLLPGVFLPVIEEHSLAVDVGEWVIGTALAQMELWQAAGLTIPVSVNVSARQLLQADFVTRLRELLAEHPNVEHGNLELEVLETSAMEDLVKASGVIGASRKLGVSFALDDFGTGYSSLTYLKRLPVSALKIDQSFVRDMLDDPDDMAILEGVLGLATAFRLQVIAEGVETVEHGTLLLQLGCDLAQGYGIARPMPADQLPAWLAVWRPDPAWVELPSFVREDMPLLFASVEHRAWIAGMEKYFKGERETPMPLNMHQCRFGQWLDTDGLSRYGWLSSFPTIERLHRQVHELATELCNLHTQDSDTEAALARLGELHSLRDALLEQLKTLAHEIRQ